MPPFPFTATNKSIMDKEVQHATCLKIAKAGCGQRLLAIVMCSSSYSVASNSAIYSRVSYYHRAIATDSCACCRCLRESPLFQLARVQTLPPYFPRYVLLRHP